MVIEPLKVAFIGGWGHAYLVLDEMDGMNGVSLCAVAPAFTGEDTSMITGHRACRHSGAAEFDDAQTMLDAVRPDVAVVSSRPDQIAPAATLAAKAGCHLICEKPLGVSHRQLEELRTAVMNNKVRLMAMHSMRNYPAFIAARKAFQTGLIGDAVQVDARKSYRWGVRPDWFGRRAMYGGIIPWVGIHALDAIHFVAGQRMTRLFAMHGNIAHPDFAECEDHALIAGRLDNGAHASISIDMVRPDESELPADDWLRVMGTKGMIEANASKGFCEIAAEGIGQSPLSLPEPGRMFGEYLLSLRGEGEAPLSMEDSFMLTRTALVARDSADSSMPLSTD